MNFFEKLYQNWNTFITRRPNMNTVAKAIGSQIEPSHGEMFDERGLLTFVRVEAVIVDDRLADSFVILTTGPAKNVISTDTARKVAKGMIDAANIIDAIKVAREARPASDKNAN